MNTVALVGRVTKDIEVRKTQNGKSVAQFTLAVNRRGKDNGADFIPCVAWEKAADTLSMYVHKGDRVGITGSISTRNYTDNSGQKRYITEVAVHAIEFMQDKRETHTEEPMQEEPKGPYGKYGGAIYDNDLPF